MNFEKFISKNFHRKGKKRLKGKLPLPSISKGIFIINNNNNLDKVKLGLRVNQSMRLTIPQLKSLKLNLTKFISSNNILKKSNVQLIFKIIPSIAVSILNSGNPGGGGSRMGKGKGKISFYCARVPKNFIICELNLDKNFKIFAISSLNKFLSKYPFLNLIS